MARQQASVPDGLYLVMRPWLKEVLRFQPEDIVRFSRDYFTSLCNGDEENFLNTYAKEYGFPADRKLLEEKESKMHGGMKSGLDALSGGSNMGSRRNSRKKDLEYSQADSSSSAGLGGLLPAKIEPEKRLSHGQFNIAATQTVNTTDNRGGTDDGNDKPEKDAASMHMLLAIAVHAIHKALNNAFQGQAPTPTVPTSPTAMLLSSPTSASTSTALAGLTGKAKAPVRDRANRDAYYDLSFEYGTNGSTASIAFPDDFPRSRAILRLKGAVGSGDKKRIVDKKIPIEAIATQSADCGPFVKEVLRHLVEEGSTAE